MLAAPFTSVQNPRFYTYVSWGAASKLHRTFEWKNDSQGKID